MELNNSPTEVEWRTALDEIGVTNIQLTWEYMEMLERLGYAQVRLIANEGSRPKGIAAGRILRNFGIAREALFGSVAGSGVWAMDEAAMESMINHISTFNRSKGVLREKIHCTASPSLQKLGYSATPAFTFRLDIGNIEQAWQNMHKHCRNAIRAAEKAEVIVREVKTHEEIRTVYDLVVQQARRWGWHPPQMRRFELIQEMMAPKGLARFFLAEWQGKPVAGALVHAYRDFIFLPVWGNNEAARECHANNLILWRIAEWGNRNGFRTFDLWGTDPLALPGIHSFKADFGAKLIEGSMNVRVNRPLLHHIVNNVAVPLYKKVEKVLA